MDAAFMCTCGGALRGQLWSRSSRSRPQLPSSFDELTRLATVINRALM